MKETKYDKGSLGIFYPLWRKLNNFRFYNQLVQEAVGELNLHSGDRVLEVACGPGYSLKYLSEVVGDSGSVLATDYSEKMLSYAQREISDHYLANVKLEKADAASISYDKEFDAAIVVLGLSVIPNWEQALEKTIKAVKPGGCVVILDSKLAHKSPVGNFFTKLFFFWLDAEDRDIRSVAQKHLDELSYREYKNGSYFLFAGERSVCEVV